MKLNKLLLTQAVAGFFITCLQSNVLEAGVSTPYIATVNYFAGGLDRHDAATGAYIDTIGHLPVRRSELNLGPDGNFYVTIFSFSNEFEIMRIDARTAETTQFIDASPFGAIRGMDFGPNGNLFVAGGNNAILEFSGQTGQYIREFITGISTPIDLDFAPDGSLFVAQDHHQATTTSSILQYNGQTGAFIRTFATSQVDTPQNVLVGLDGDVFVTNQWTNASPLVRFDGATGEVKFAVSHGLINPQGMTFRANGELLVASWDDTIKRFDATTGSFLGNLVSAGVFDDPVGVVFVPEPSALLLAFASASVMLAGRRTPGFGTA